MVNEGLEQNMVPQPDAPGWRKWEWMFLIMALLIAGCYFFAHFPCFFAEKCHFPGIGWTISQWIFIAVSLFAAKSKRKLHIKGNPGGVFLLCAALLLGACYAVFNNESMRWMNMPVYFLATASSLFSLSGVNPFPALSASGLRMGLKRFFPSHFIHWLLPFQAIKHIKVQKYRRYFSHIAIGLILGFPAAAIAICLLSSADAYFGSIVQSCFQSMDQINGDYLIRMLCTLALGMCLFSFLCAAAGKPFQPSEKKTYHASSVVLVTVLIMVGTVYALFVYVQFKYLFWGAEKIIQETGYAEYARSGFFQLAALSFLTLLLIFPFLSLGKESRPVRFLCAMTALLTVIIDYSAFLRMKLYIQAFGLSILRVVTLWGMLMILVALTASVVKCVCPAVSICPFLTVLALCTWIALNWGNVDRMVARYQVNSFNRGMLTQLDIAYLSALSPDVLPELERISDEHIRTQALSEARKAFSQYCPRPYDWSLSWLKVNCGDRQEENTR